MAGMSQADFGAALGVSRSLIAQIESGRKSPATGLRERAEALAASASGDGGMAEGVTGDEAAAHVGTAYPEQGMAEVPSASTEAPADEVPGNELARLHEAVERLTREVELNTRPSCALLEAMPDPGPPTTVAPARRPGNLGRAVTLLAIAYGTAGAFVLTGLLVRHGPERVFALMADFATDSGRWLLDLVPFV